MYRGPGSAVQIQGLKGETVRTETVPLARVISLIIARRDGETVAAFLSPEAANQLAIALSTMAARHGQVASQPALGPDFSP